MKTICSLSFIGKLREPTLWIVNCQYRRSERHIKLLVFQNYENSLEILQDWMFGSLQ